MTNPEQILEKVKTKCLNYGLTIQETDSILREVKSLYTQGQTDFNNKNHVDMQLMAKSIFIG